MKAKELKLLRKKLTKLNKADFDPLKEVSPEILAVSTRDDVDTKLDLAFVRSAKLPKSRMEECLALFESNMGEMYEKSSWGLDMKEKAEEFNHANACFLLLTNAENSLAGFVHFRFDYDDDEQPTQGVLYVYELQIDAVYRRQGLGKRMMEISEHIAGKSELPRVMLTVFKKNGAAMDFYKKIGYEIDDSSPSNFNEPADYEILSKVVVQQ